MKLLKSLIISFFILQASVSFAAIHKENVSVYLFWGKGCAHCKRAMTFLDKMQKKYPDIQVKYLEIWENQENLDLMRQIAKELNFRVSGLPVTVIGNQYFVGFYDEQSTGQSIEESILFARSNGTKDFIQDHVNRNGKAPIATTANIESINLPIFGEVNIKDFSLPLLTILIGAIDGFNPCALWVLIMLLSFLIAIENRKKMIYLGTLFIVTSAFVYYLFLVAWLNVMFFLSYIQGVKILIGLIAVGGGGYYLKEYFTNKEGTCKVTRQKQKISEKLSKVVNQKRYWLATIGIIFLAFFVNLIELICSAGLPAIYTQVLAITPLSKLGYHLYLLLYTFVFMLDDLFIFFVAVISLDMVKLTTKYSRYSHLIGGIILLCIGVLLIFKPEWLMFA